MYSLIIVPEGPSVYRQLVNKTLLAHSGISAEENQWIDLKVEVEGNRIDVYMDDTMLFRYRDTTPLLSGSISFVSPEDSVIYVDDVIVMLAR
jgi:hypothetical protein